MKTKSQIWASICGLNWSFIQMITLISLICKGTMIGDHCLYSKWLFKELFTSTVHIHDVLMSFNPKKDDQHNYGCFSSHFDKKDMRNVVYVLEVRTLLYWSKWFVEFSQEIFQGKVLSHYNISVTKPIHAPIIKNHGFT